MRRALRKTSLAEPDSYFKLVRQFPLRRIRNEAEYDAAVEVMNALAVRGEDALDAGESDYLEALATFVSQYDDVHYKIPYDHRAPFERLASLVEENGMTHAALAKLLGVSRPLATLLLSGKRELQRSHIYKLADRFKLEPGYFL